MVVKRVPVKIEEFVDEAFAHMPDNDERETDENSDAAHTEVCDDPLSPFAEIAETVAWLAKILFPAFLAFAAVFLVMSYAHFATVFALVASREPTIRAHDILDFWEDLHWTDDGETILDKFDAYIKRDVENKATPPPDTRDDAHKATPAPDTHDDQEAPLPWDEQEKAVREKAAEVHEEPKYLDTWPIRYFKSDKEASKDISGNTFHIVRGDGQPLSRDLVLRCVYMPNKSWKCDDLGKVMPWVRFFNIKETQVYSHLEFLMRVD